MLYPTPPHSRKVRIEARFVSNGPPFLSGPLDTRPFEMELDKDEKLEGLAVNPMSAEIVAFVSVDTFYEEATNRDDKLSEIYEAFTTALEDVVRDKAVDFVDPIEALVGKAESTLNWPKRDIQALRDGWKGNSWETGDPKLYEMGKALLSWARETRQAYRDSLDERTKKILFPE